MLNNIILFRADSSFNIGTGHIMRDLVLAKQYEERGCKIIFVTQNLDGNINDKIPYQIELLQDNSINEFIKVIEKYNPKQIVIDHYKIDRKKEKKIKSLYPNIKLLCFDDTYEKHYCDIVLNHNISANKDRYKDLVPKKCELRCGAKYTLLRDEFIEEKKRKNIFIAMGGIDTANLNLKILKILAKFRNIQVNIVTTNGNKNLEKLKKYCKDKNWINLYINSNKIAKLMKQSNFAIVTPSVILNEIIYMKIDFIAIKTAQNQKYFCQYLTNNNYIFLNKFDKKLLKFELKLKLGNIEIKNFTSLKKYEKQLILDWRNHKEIRKWMFAKKQINLKDHLNYIDSLQDEDGRVYFLVKQYNQYIGVVNFVNINKKQNSAELGIYSNPNLKAVGSILLQTIIDYGFMILTLKFIKVNVFKENIKAINLYKRFGFKFIHQHNDLFYMELNNENRKF